MPAYRAQIGARRSKGAGEAHEFVKTLVVETGRIHGNATLLKQRDDLPAETAEPVARIVAAGQGVLPIPCRGEYLHVRILKRRKPLERGRRPGFAVEKRSAPPPSCQ